MKKLLPKLALSLGATLATLLLLEVGGRLAFDPVSRMNLTGVPRSLHAESEVPGIPFSLRPSSEAVHEYRTDPRGYFGPGARLTYRTNSLGFRGEETTVEKPSGTFRILGLGDSFTFGTGVRQGDTFLAGLESRLNRAAGSTRYEALNLGVMAYNTVAEVSLLEHRGLAFQPDLVVICFVLNDASGGRDRSARGGPRVHLNPKVAFEQLPFWRRHSRLLDRAAAVIDRRRGMRRLVASYQDSFREDSEGWIRAQQALRRARELSHEHSFHLVLAIFPVLVDLSDGYAFAEIHAKVRSAGEALSIPVLDLLPAFSGFSGDELWVHPNDQHPNEIAHGVAAEALHEFVTARRLLEPPR